MSKVTPLAETAVCTSGLSQTADYAGRTYIELCNLQPAGSAWLLGRLIWQAASVAARL